MKRFLLWAISPLYWAGAAAAVIGLGSAAYTANKQEDAQDDLDETARQAAIDAEAERQRVLNQSIEQQGSATVTFGTGEEKANQSYSDFLTPKDTTTKALGGSTTSGLGFS